MSRQSSPGHEEEQSPDEGRTQDDPADRIRQQPGEKSGEGQNQQRANHEQWNVHTSEIGSGFRRSAEAREETVIGVARHPRESPPADNKGSQWIDHGPFHRHGFGTGPDGRLRRASCASSVDSNEAHRPLLLTSRGRGVAVVQSISDYELAEEEHAFMRTVVAGMADLHAGREVSLAEARNRLGLP